jgi:hypothetical protein
MICFFCGAKISYYEISRQQMRNRVNQCGHLNLICRLYCNKCRKICSYLSLQKHRKLYKNTLINIILYNGNYLQKHKELFKNTLIDINGRLK